MRRSPSSVAQQGFTLMELIIAMVIIGILTAIALPNYTAYIQRSNRSEARNQLLEMSVWMERWRTERGRYDDPGNINNPPPSPPFPANWVQSPPLPATAKYTIVRAATATTFTFTATAVGVMAGDACTTLVIDQTGQRTFTTGGGGTQDICWNR